MKKMKQLTGKFLFPAILLLIALGCQSDINAQLRENLKAFAISERGDVFFLAGKKVTELDKINSENSSDYYSLESNFVTGSSFQNDDFVILQRHRGMTVFDKDLNKKKTVEGILPRKVIFDAAAVREITAISVDQQFFTHKHDILMRSENGKYVKIEHNLSKTNYFTALEKIGPYLYVATSLNGLYRGVVTDKKINLQKISNGLPYIPYDDKLYFYEEIGAVHSSDGKDLWVGVSLQGGVYYKGQNDQKFTKIEWPFRYNELVDIRQIRSSVKKNQIWISTSKGLIIKPLDQLARTKKIEKSDFHDFLQFSQANQLLAKQLSQLQFLAIADREDPLLSGFQVLKRNPENPEKSKVREKTTNKEVFYSSAYNYKTKTAQVDAMLDRNNFNGIVLDLKDDFGYVRYHSEIEFIKQIGALRPMIDLKKFLEKARTKNKYVIARVVVFQDPVLYKIKGYSLKDKYTNGPWAGNGKEFWIDAYNPDLVNKYYIPLVKELEKWGINEIQLDYIRFPSDGPIYKVKSDYNKNETIYPSEALENFISQIANAISIPLAVDIYGYNGMYRAPGAIGQDIEAYGRHVDVVCPMLYSSHFGKRYMTTDRPREKRAVDLMEHSALRYLHLAQTDYLVRPYLQGFNMAAGLWGSGEKYYADQIAGTEKAGGKGFLFWGPFAELLKVENAIKTLRKTR